MAAALRVPRAGRRSWSFVLFMFAVLGMAGLAIDVGHWYQEKQAVQAEADASALAGASALPVGWSSAVTAASSNFAKNEIAGDSPTYTNTDEPDRARLGDGIDHPRSRGRSSRRCSGSTTCRHGVGAGDGQVVLTVTSNHDIMPWGVMRNSFTPGQPYEIYTDNSSSNNGALSLPYVNNVNCPVPNGASPYRDEISGALNACPISLQEMLDVKPGQNAGPTRQGIDTRITNWKPLNQIVDYSDPAHARVLDSSSKQLVLIPIVEDPNGGTNWLNGSGQVRVIGFAWFVITGPPGYTANGKTVTGVFVGLEDPATAGDQTGAWNPNGNQNLATTIVLTQ